jgi:hypothetical protein
VYFSQPFIADLANAVKTFSDEEFVVEAVGILGNIAVRGLDYAQLLTKHDMLSYIKSKLQPGNMKLHFVSGNAQC